MQIILKDSEYAFDASNNTITLTEPYTALSLGQVISIVNLTTGDDIYLSKKLIHPISIAAAIITHTYDNSGHADTDKLQIIVDTIPAVTSSVSCITWTFTTDDSGNASNQSDLVNGIVKRAVTNPDSAPDTPTAGWDLTIEDEDGVDVLCGNGADRDADGSKASEQVFPCPGNLAVASKLTFKVANAGDTKKGVVKLYTV